MLQHQSNFANASNRSLGRHKGKQIEFGALVMAIRFIRYNISISIHFSRTLGVFFSNANRPLIRANSND